MPCVDVSAGPIEYHDTAGVGPTIVVWATEDRIMPREHGQRLTAAFPNGQLVEVADGYTLIPEDQPTIPAAHLRALIANNGPGAVDGSSQ
jgi:pimeloyl-ACP methyl ester carboxylesterase